MLYVDVPGRLMKRRGGVPSNTSAAKFYFGKNVGLGTFPLHFCVLTQQNLNKKTQYRVLRTQEIGTCNYCREPESHV